MLQLGHAPHSRWVVLTMDFSTRAPRGFALGSATDCGCPATGMPAMKVHTMQCGRFMIYPGTDEILQMIWISILGK